MHVAAKHGHDDVLRVMLNAGADVELAMPVSGSRPLHMAAAAQERQATKLLIDANADPAQPDAAGRTPAICVPPAAIELQYLLQREMLDVCHAAGRRYNSTELLRP